MTCHNCRIECVKNGKRNGLQRYVCSQCGKKFQDQRDFGLIGHKQAVDEHQALLALRLLVEGNSIRSTQRISGIDKKTIMRLLLIAGSKCETLMNRLIRNVPVRDVQADEIWTYVAKKQANLRGRVKS